MLSLHLQARPGDRQTQTHRQQDYTRSTMIRSEHEAIAPTCILHQHCIRMGIIGVLPHIYLSIYIPSFHTKKGEGGVYLHWTGLRNGVYIIYYYHNQRVCTFPLLLLLLLLFDLYLFLSSLRGFQRTNKQTKRTNERPQRVCVRMYAYCTEDRDRNV